MPGIYRGSGGCLSYMEVWVMPVIYGGSGGCLAYIEGLGDAWHI